MTRLRTLVDALDDAARSPEGYTFVSRGVETRRSYAQIRDAAILVGQRLLDAGLRPGDLVAVAVAEAEPFLTVLFGASAAGLVPATIAPPTMTGELSEYFAQTARIVRSAAARAVITTPELTGGFGDIQTRCPDLSLVLSAADLCAGDPITRASAEPLERPVSVDRLALVQFTSGSTSAPKGVALSHRNLCANIDAINGPAGLATSSSDSAVSWLPLHHDMGLIGMALGPLYSSRPAVFLEPHAFIKRPVDWLKAISRHQATVSFAPTFAYQLVLRRLADRDLAELDLSPWRVAGCGAEPIHAASLETFAARLAGVGFRRTSFLPCYGLAEHVLAATLSPRERGVRIGPHGPSVVGCGPALPGHRLRVIREDGRDADEGETGEILLAGPSVMLGYYNHAQATAETIQNGWLHTGDLGYLADGELFVCGRAKDTVIINGRNYHPQDFEWALEDLDVVRRGHVVAFGVGEAGAGDRIVVAVEARRGQPQAALFADIRARIADRFGLYVDDIVCVPPGTISRTTSGKIRRVAVKVQYEQKMFAGSPGDDG